MILAVTASRWLPRVAIMSGETSTPGSEADSTTQPCRARTGRVADTTELPGALVAIVASYDTLVYGNAARTNLSVTQVFLSVDRWRFSSARRMRIFWGDQRRSCR